MWGVYTKTRANEISEILIWIHGLRLFFPASNIVRRLKYTLQHQNSSVPGC